MHLFVVLIYIGLMRKDYEKLFTHLKPKEPSVRLFDRIILAIQREQELRHTKRLVFSFFTLLIISLVATPFSFALFTEQMENSGILYFFSAAISDLNMFFALWQDFGIAIIEANYFGVPAIGSKLSGIEDAIEDGVTGFVVNPKSPSEILYVLKIIVDKYNQFSRSALIHSRKFEWNNKINEYLEVIEECAES